MNLSFPLGYLCTECV